MNALLDLYVREPAVVLSSAGALVTAIVVVLVSFGLPITVEQRTAINALVILVITISASVAVRSQVSPVAALLSPAPLSPMPTAAPADMPPHG